MAEVSARVVEAGDYLLQVQGMEVKEMFLFCGVIAVLILVLCFVAGMAVYFAEDISEYLQAKTEELEAMTEVLRKEKEDERN